MKRKQTSKVSLKRLLQDNSVPIMFVLICLVCLPLAGYSPAYLLNELVTRMGRNTFLILALLIPIMAGMGLNFGMTLGAMAGEIALILVVDWQIWGIPGIILAMIISIPISILLGLFCGNLLNKAKGREMVTSYFISYFMNGVYQLVVLFLMGSIIPIMHSTLKLPRGYGIRNTVSLLSMRQQLDNLLAINVGGVKIPVLTFLIVAVLCLVIIWFRRTKLGQDMRAVAQDMNVARDAGINVDRIKWLVYTFCGVMAAVAGLIESAGIKGADCNNAGLLIEMDAILAVAIGGTSLNGGRFSIPASLVGALIIQSITTSIYAMGVAPEVTLVVKSLIVVFICLFQSKAFKDMLKRRFLSRKAVSQA